MIEYLTLNKDLETETIHIVSKINTLIEANNRQEQAIEILASAVDNGEWGECSKTVENILHPSPKEEDNK